MTWILEGAAVLCLLYYGVISVYSGVSTSFSLFWLFMAAFLALLAAGLHFYSRHREQIPLWIPVSVVTACTAGALIFVVTLLLIGWGAITASRKPADYVVVLGAKVNGTELSNSLQKRLNTALKYAEDNPNTVLVLSGGQGQGEDISEARAMFEYLQYNGIPAERMLLEDQSFNTVENITFSRKVIERQEHYKALAAQQTLQGEYHVRPEQDIRIAVLTSSYHIFRSKAIAEKQGIYHVGAVSAPSDPVLAVHLWIREGFAVLKDKFMGKL